ncbi:MAG: hypothetical protein HMLKMBBP_03209 [Planctomycetes bacterium]|nr:hypothetical protein [Planctomycetota bacterium]
MNFVWFVLIGIAAGWLAGKLTKGSGFGWIGDLILGVLGAVVGGWIAGLLGISWGGVIGSLVVATGGALVLLWASRMFKK